MPGRAMEVTNKLLAAIALCLVVRTSVTGGYRILGVFPHTAKSHFIMSGTIMRELATRGHEVVVISPFPEKNPPKNYRDITYVDPSNTIVDSFTLDMVGGARIVETLYVLYSLGVETCEATYSSQKVQELLKSDEKFDLVMVEIFNTECFLPFAHRFNASLVGISSSVLMPWANERFGNPDDPSYIPVHFTGYTDRMTFSERLANTLILSAVKVAYDYVFNYKANQIVRKYFGEMVPTVEEMASKMSLLLVNSHFALHQPRPLVPAVVEVGGIHMKEPKAMPKEFEQFLNESEHGVIYFSLGSTVRSDSFPEPMRQAFLEAFSHLPQRVLWKWESGSMPGQPSNVKIAKWMPQLEILSHPNVKAFITHGGLMGTMEAAYFGVPMIVIPLFGDQYLNAQSYVQKGIAVQLDYGTIDKKTVSAALRAVLQEPSYAENARRVSKALRDAPLSPVDTAVYWTEYVAKHGGAPHLRCAAADLPWYQLKLLDVFAVLLLGAVLLGLLIRAAARRLFSGAKRQEASNKGRKSKTS
ncbi:UDP-glycosyltransferase UGT5-like isoform X2 [Bacillus rossius redtenbacheri]|uniref:UDP-glycosyltransferase UGT5-like isoform X2 n=1 Tax=Bacillus rossius redtenbacheri TaxID=93214 RepID=UPI002FDD58B6